MQKLSHHRSVSPNCIETVSFQAAHVGSILMIGSLLPSPVMCLAQKGRHHSDGTCRHFTPRRRMRDVPPEARQTPAVLRINTNHGIREAPVRAGSRRLLIIARDDNGDYIIKATVHEPLESNRMAFKPNCHNLLRCAVARRHSHVLRSPPIFTAHNRVRQQPKIAPDDRERQVSTRGIASNSR